jgi:hypothetical protein
MKGGARTGAGRPSSFTPEVAERICERIEAGKRPRVAAAEEGVSPSTFDGWMSEARAGKKPELIEFREAVARAVLVSEGKLYDTLKDGDEPGYSFGPAKAALEILSRTNKHYSTKIQVALESELERVLDAVQRVCSPEDFQRVLAELAALDSESEASEAQSPSVH